MQPDLETEFLRLRPALLRHCYRMVGSFAEAEDLVQTALERAWKARATASAVASLPRWLFTIATNACLNALASRKARSLPQLESDAATGEFALHEQEPSLWIGPAPDARLATFESHESVALAFVALLQRLPPRQRAALLMKDVLGWSAEEIAAAHELTVSSVNSALNRGRQSMARAPQPASEPAPAVLEAFVRAWATRDVAALVALLREDVVMEMPPHAVWLRGVGPVERFLGLPRFAAYWSSVLRVVATRANGLPALLFCRRLEDGSEGAHSVMVARFVDGLVAEVTVFVGTGYATGFELPAE